MQHPRDRHSFSGNRWTAARWSLLVEIVAAAIPLAAVLFLLPQSVGASPPPIPRSELPRLEAQLRSHDPQLQATALGDLASLDGGLTSDLLRLAPRVLEICHSQDDEAVIAALYVVGEFSKDAEARRRHGRAMVEAIGKALSAKSADVRSTALYVLHPELVVEQWRQASPLLVAGVADKDEETRITAVVKLGQLPKADVTMVDALRQALRDPAMQVRRQSTFALSNLARSSSAAIPELLQALRDEHGEVSAGAGSALSQMGDPAAAGLLGLIDAKEPRVRLLAMEALATGYSTGRITDEKHGQAIGALVERKLADPDTAVQRAAAIRVSIFGGLTARVSAMPILVKALDDQGTLLSTNAHHGILRCLCVFAADLTDEAKADEALRGFRQVDEAFLKTWLGESGRGEIRTLLQKAVDKGVAAEHRAFAGKALQWLPAP